MKEANKPHGHAASSEAIAEAVDEQTVVDFLRRDQDFFVRHPGLLSELNLPHSSGRAVSLVEHQVGILRERNMDMRRRVNDLVTTARANDEIFAKTRSLTLALLEAGSRQELNEVLATHVLVDFEADFVCCHLIGDVNSLDHIQIHKGEFPFGGHLTPRSALCTTLRAEELIQLFPNADHAENSSAVLLPLAYTGDGEITGILGIGSRDPQRFSGDMDTLFVAYIGDILGKLLTRFRL